MPLTIEDLRRAGLAPNAILHSYQTREEWAAARTRGLGGSDIAAIVGLSPWAGPWDVFAAKTSGLQTKPESLRMRLGTALEPFLCAEYEREHSRTPIPNTALFQSGRHPWQVGTPDAFLDPLLGIEWKTTDSRNASQWGDEEDAVPDYYAAQVAWYGMICDIPEWHLSVLIGNNDFRTYRLTRDPDLEDALLDAGARFWRDHIKTGRPPAIQAGDVDAAGRWIQARFASHRAPLRKATEEEELLLCQLRTIRKDLAQLEKDGAILETSLKALLEDAEGIEGPGFRLTWKKTKDSTRTDWEAVVKHLPRTEQLDRLIRGATRTVPGSRRFLPKWEAE